METGIEAVHCNRDGLLAPAHADARHAALPGAAMAAAEQPGGAWDARPPGNTPAAQGIRQAVSRLRPTGRSGAGIFC
jgi:hypothetical protein